MSNEKGPLSGLRVLEIGQYIAGPYASKLLADLGADVIKVESPEGDPMRRWEGASTSSPQFSAYNRNKRGIVADLKSEDGLGALVALARGADVLIENFRPGVADRLGFGYEALSAANPGIVYCSITGFGSTGEHSRRPSYDTVVSAVAGVYSQIMPTDAARPVGPAFSDLLAGSSAAHAVLAALYARVLTGRGDRIEVSMVGAVLDFLTEAVSTYVGTGSVSGPDSRPRRAQAYALVGSDGRAFVVHMSVPEKFWLGLLEVLEHPELAADERFSTREARVANYDALDAELKRIAAERPTAVWLDRLAERDIPHGPLNTVDTLFDDPRVSGLGLLHEVDGVPTPVHSTIFAASGRPEYHSAPELGGAGASWKDRT